MMRECTERRKETAFSRKSFPTTLKPIRAKLPVSDLPTTSWTTPVWGYFVDFGKRFLSLDDIGFFDG